MAAGGGRALSLSTTQGLASRSAAISSTSWNSASAVAASQLPSATIRLSPGLARRKAATASAMSGPEDRRSEEHTSELQSLMRISYAVFCLKKKKHNLTKPHTTNNSKK